MSACYIDCSPFMRPLLTPDLARRLPGLRVHDEPDSPDAVVERLNPALRGWAGYFRHGNSSKKFAIVNSYVHQRMAILASNKHGRSGRNWATRFNYGWFTSLGIYRLTGTVGNRPAHALG